jgi:hypothetical protein
MFTAASTGDIARCSELDQRPGLSPGVGWGVRLSSFSADLTHAADSVIVPPSLMYLTYGITSLHLRVVPGGGWCAPGLGASRSSSLLDLTRALSFVIVVL